MRRYQWGFTIIELMVTLIILAVLVGITVPSFTALIQRNASVAIGEQFVTALNFTRSEAIKRRASVSLCASNDTGTACGNNWTNGWIIFTDGSAETATSVAVVEVLRFWNDIDENAEIDVKRGAAQTNFIRFAGTGVLARVNGSTDSVSASAKYRNCTGEAARVVTIGLSGMINSKAAQCLEASNEESE